MKAFLHPSYSASDRLGGGWERPIVIYEIIAFRTGWIGAWDAIRAAWRKDTRLQLPTNLTIYTYFKAGGGGNHFSWGCQVETRQS